jgi:hypothetical protein
MTSTEKAGYPKIVNKHFSHFRMKIFPNLLRLLQKPEVGIANFFLGLLIANLLIFFLNPLNANPLIFKLSQSANR